MNSDFLGYRTTQHSLCFTFVLMTLGLFSGPWWVCYTNLMFAPHFPRGEALTFLSEISSGLSSWVTLAGHLQRGREEARLRHTAAWSQGAPQSEGDGATACYPVRLGCVSVLCFHGIHLCAGTCPLVTRLYLGFCALLLECLVQGMLIPFFC